MEQYNFPMNLRRERKERGLTQDELAQGIGVSRVTVSEWETNTRYPTLDRIYDIAKFLKIPVSTLVSDFQKSESKAD